MPLSSEEAVRCRIATCAPGFHAIRVESWRFLAIIAHFLLFSKVP
jgi:hypothetical protein